MLRRSVGCGKRLKIKRMSLINPRSNIRICLIHDRHLDVAQIEHMLLEVVDDAAGRADQDVDAFFENAALLFIIHAAEHDGELETGVLADAERIGCICTRARASAR